MGLEGIESKRLTAPYRSGPSRDWFKVTNPTVLRWCGRGKRSGEGKIAMRSESRGVVSPPLAGYPPPCASHTRPRRALAHR
jgi:hypothetical protein